MNFYKHYVGDYQKKTKRLSLLHHGCYRILIDEYYATEQALPSNMNQLYRICTALKKSEQDAVKFIISQYFQLVGDEYHHERIDIDLEKYRTICDTNRAVAVQREAQRIVHGTYHGQPTNPLTTNHKPIKKQRQNKYSDDDFSLAEWMFGKIKELYPNHKKPNLEKWANEIRLICEIDKQPHNEIRTLFTFANKHDFWRKNILSPASLRKQWDRLCAEKQEGGNGKSEIFSAPCSKSDHKAIDRWAEKLGINTKPFANYFDLYRRCTEVARTQS